MERNDIWHRYDAAIDRAVSGAGAKLDAGAKSDLSDMTMAAANYVAMRVEEEQHEDAVKDGIAVYQKLIGKMVTAAKTMTMFPELNKHALGVALDQLGPNPPFIVR